MRGRHSFGHGFDLQVVKETRYKEQSTNSLTLKMRISSRSRQNSDGLSSHFWIRQQGPKNLLWYWDKGLVQKGLWFAHTLWPKGVKSQWSFYISNICRYVLKEWVWKFECWYFEKVWVLIFCESLRESVIQTLHGICKACVWQERAKDAKQSHSLLNWTLSRIKHFNSMSYSYLIFFPCPHCGGVWTWLTIDKTTLKGHLSLFGLGLDTFW